jgi:rfaE bifunctional protein kinase chain/domain
MESRTGFSRNRLEALLTKIRDVRVVLIGDMGLDVYWRADMTRSELSRETPHFPLPIVEETCLPGAGGNVAANLAALRPSSVHVLSVIGRDWRGDILSRLLQDSGLDISGLVVSQAAVTPAYCKPRRFGFGDLVYEDPRLDFANFSDLPPQDEQSLLANLDRCITTADIVCVADQFRFGCITTAVRERLCAYGRAGVTVVADSRDRIGLFTDIILKPNEIECCRAVGQIADPSHTDLARCSQAARLLAECNQAKVCLTLGAAGSLYTDGAQAVHVPAPRVQPPLDICGAGDTFLAAFACALAAGALPGEAAALANLASAVTIRKIGVTGTASPEEIIACHRQMIDQKDHRS